MFSRQIMFSWMHDTERYRRFVLAVLRHWDALDAEGPRYSWASNHGERLWAIPTALQSALANLGVPSTLLQEPLPIGGLYTLLAQADRALAGSLVDLGQLRAASYSPVNSTPTSWQAPVDKPPEGTFMSDQMSAAVEANDPAAVRQLLEAGEPITAVHPSLLRSPLLWAAEQGHVGLVRFLLDCGAPIEDRADEWESPLMLAAQRGHRDIVRLLLDRGADPYYVTNKGFNILHFAERSKDAEVFMMLKALWSEKDSDFHRAARDH
jgi:hypothetical protein